MLFILNSDLQIIDTLSVKGIISQGNTPYFEDYYTQILATGAETFEFKTMADSRESRNIIVGNYIAFRDDNGDDKLFNIIETNESRSEQGFIKSVYCEMHGIELKNNVIRPMKMLNTSLEKFAETILSDTDWQVGEIDDFGGLLDINIEEHISVYDAIQKYAIGEFGAEIYYTVEIKSNSVVNKYLNIVENRGLDEGIKFTYNKNIQNIERTIDTSNLCTALIGVGNNGLTFKNVEASDKPLNQDFIVNETAYQQWSKNGYHIFGYETFETDSEQELLKLTRNKLYERGTPRVKYELNVELLDADVRIGDYVRITDMEFEPPIMLEARISTLTKSKTDINGNQCEISNFKHLQSNITEQMRKLSSNLKGYADNINIDNISKGGFLSSKITVVDESTLGIGNQVETGKDFCVDFKNLTAETVLTDFVLPNKKVMQQAIVDYHENKIYISCDETSNGNVVLYQTDMSGKILGQMTLNQFGHSNSFGIERRNNRTYIWLECDAKQAYSSEPQKLRGTKLCYFEFKDGVTANKTYGTVIDILPGWVNLSLGIDDTYNQIAVRALDKIGGTYYYHVFNLDEVINGTFKAKYKFKDVGLQGTSSYQGFDILGNYIYAIQGAGYYTHPPKMDSYVTCIDIQSGKKRYVNLIDILPNAPFREIEGIKVIKKSARVYELNFGMVTEHQSPRKNHVFKYTYTVPLESNPQGKFVHPNGWTTSISEGLIKVDNSKKKNYLMYVVDGERFKFEEGFSKQIIMANYENGIWYCNGEEFKPMANDCIIGKATPNQDNYFDLTIYSESSQSLGSTLSGNSDSLMYEDGKIIVNAGGLVGQLPTDLIEVESINANHISANAITADKIQSNSIESKHIKAEVFEAINADIENLIAGKADIENLNAINANIQNLVAKDAEIENLVSNKATIEDLKASNAEIDNLKASNAEIKNLVSNKADIEQLNATNATINTLNANKANITDLQAVNAQINNLKADKADITELNAVKGNITILQSEVAEIGSIKSDVADIEHILAGNITADNIASGTITSDKIQTGTITSGSGIIADGAIGNAQISSLEASKISSGTIDTSKVTVQGTNGHLRIKGNRLQVFNGTGNQAKERVSVGDVNGDGTVYGLRVRGADGTTVLLDENGVTSEGITDGSITNEKVSDDANIDGAKLNINSVVSKLNEDGTEVIKGTKIEVNGTSLVTQLSTMTSKQTEQGEKISQNTSSIKANENAIKLKVDNQTYQTDKTNMTSTLNKHTSEISTLQDEISLKVEQTDIETANNALKSEIQEDLNDINERINDILSDVGGAIADGIIEESETIMINSSITQLNKEKETLTQRYNYIYDLSTLESSMKSSLKTTMDTYNAKQSALVSHIQSMITDKTISDSERAAYETRLTEYSTALANINKKIEECMDSISTSKVNTAKAEIKVTTDSISQSVTNLSNTVSTKADGSTVSTLSSKVGSLETSVDGITGQVSNLEKSTTSLGSQVSDLEGEITTVKSDVASLEVTTSGISQKVSSVESTTSTLSTKVTTIEDTANSASTNAASALNKANSAIEKADDAKDTADTAIETAEGANTTAGNALSTANTANNTANTNKNNITTLQTTVTTTNNKVAELTTNLDGITQRVQSTESSIQNTNNMLSEVSTGVNKVLFEMYSKTGQDGTEIVTIDDYLDATLLHTLLLDDFQMFGGADEYLGKMTTHLYFNENVTHTVQAFADDGSSIYLNGTLVASMPTCTDTPVTLNFKQGWNKIVWVYNEGNGGDGCRFTPSIKTLGGLVHMNAYPVNGDIEGLQAINSTVKTTNNRVAEIVTNLDSITQRVSSNETATLNTQTQLNNLQIGGTNTFSLENFNVPEINYWEENQVICNKTNRGFDVETRQGKLHLRLFHVIKENGYWTVSFKYKSSIPVDPIYVDICDLGVGQLSSTTDWKTFKGTVYVDHYGQGEVYNFVDIEQHINVGGYVKYEFKDVKVEKGNKPTAWSPNPNDVQQQIDNTNTEITTTNNRVAEIVTNLDGITQRVSSNESTTSTLTSQMNAVDGKINSAKNDAIYESSGIKDTRNDNQPPSWYITHYGNRTVNEFKFSDVLGIQGDSVYGTLTTKVPWTDASGGYPTQTFISSFTQTFERKGVSLDTWGEWVQVENIQGSQAKANQALTDAKAFTTTEVTKTNNRVAEIVTNLESITSRVSATETLTETTKNKIDNLKIGGRNLIKNGSFKGSAPGKDVSTFDYWRVWGTPLVCYHNQNVAPYNETGFIYIHNSDFNNATPTGIHSNRIPVSQLKKNTEYTVSYYYGREGNVLDGTARLEFLNEAQNQIVHIIQLSNSKLNMPIKPSEEYKTKITFTMPNIEFSYLQIVFDHTGLVEGHNGGSILTIIGQVQLEEGNTCTEWKPSFEESEDSINDINNNLTTNYSTTSQMNSAIEQKANQITQSVSQSYATKDEVNTIGVGGTNLLLHSSDYSDTSIWIRERAWTTSSKYRGTCIYTTDQAWADIGYSVNNLYDRGVIEPNTKYTFSCYVRSNNEAYQPNIHFYGHDNHSEQGAYVATASTTWKRISITFQWYDFSIRDYPIRLEATTSTPQSGCYLEWAGFKLEKGTKATDWTPAPEDSTESENKWLFEKYASDLANNPTATYPTFDDIKPGCLLSSELVSYFSSTGDYGSTYLGKLTASFYFEADSTQTLTCTTDDNSSWYLNGQLVDVAYSCQPKQITFYFRKGWNKLTVLYLEGYGGDGVSVEGLSGYTKMNAYNMGNIDEYGIYLNNKLISNYATKSEVTQTATDLTVKFTESGGVNLLHNGHAYRDQQGDIPYWSNNGGSVFDIHGNAGGGVRGNFFSLSMPSGMQYNDWIELKGNTHYVYQAQVWVGSPFTGSHNVPLHYWFSSNKSDVNKNGSVEFLDYNTTVSYAQTWTQIYIHFRTTEDVYMKPFIYGIDSSISPFYITEIMLSESRVVQRYSPHPSEVYDGITKIDKDGIQVSQSNISTTTKMNANGFYINKGGTDVFKVDSNGLVMNGNVTATSGRVANFTISGNDLIGSSVGMGGASGNNYAFWAGSNTSSSAPFRVGHNGALTATNATISGNISGSTISGSSFSSYGTNSDSGQSQSMSLDSGLLSLEGSFTGGTNAGQQANKTYVYSNGIVVKDISASGNAGNGDAFYSNTGISFRAKSSGGEQYGSLSKIMTFGSDRISTTKNMYAEKFYGAGLFCTYTNLYLGCDGEVRATDMNGRNDGNTVYKPIRASKFMRADGKHAYINNTGGGTLTSADSALVANGMRTDATDFFLGVGGQVRVTDKNGYNNGNGLTYKPITASAHNNSSDLIFKKNIKKLDDSKNIKMFSENKESFAIKTLKDVTVYEYDLVDGEENQIGLIAQECPQVLRGSDAMYDLDIETANSITDEERKELINEDVVGASINLYSMATMLWKVCQEQQTMIEKLEKRISELENKVTE